MSLIDILTRSAKGTKTPQSFQPLLAQALSEAGVRYSPQYDQLNQIREQSAQTMRQSIAQAQAAGQLNAALALEAHKAIAGDNSTAIQQALAYQQAPPGSSTQRVGLGISLGHDATGNILAQSAADAPIAAAQQGLQARALHQQDLGKIDSQRASLFGQAGQYVSGRYGDLITADRKTRADANKAARDLKAGFVKAGVDPTTGQVVKGGPKDPAITHPAKPPAGPSTIAKPPASYPGSAADWNNASRADRERWLKTHPTGKGGTTVPNPSGIKLLPPTAQAGQVAKINGAFANIKQLMSHPQAVKSEVETLLRAGKVDGVKYTQDQIDVGFDRYHNKGRVSNRGARKLHSMGVSVAGHYKNAGAGSTVVGPPAPAGPAGRPA